MLNKLGVSYAIYFKGITIEFNICSPASVTEIFL